MANINTVLLEMINYYQGDPKRIQHFLKVHSFAKFIAEQENLPSDKLYILEIAGLMHDIGFAQLPKEAVALFSKSKNELSHEEKKKFYEHTEVAANVLKEKPFINSTILELIYNHEEVLSGNGPHKKKKLSKFQQDKLVFGKRLLLIRQFYDW